MKVAMMLACAAGLAATAGAAEGGEPIHALLITGKNNHNWQYTSRLHAETLEAIAHLIRTGTGPLGTSREYFESTVRALEGHGIRDAGIERMRRAIVRMDLAAGVA